MNTDTNKKKIVISRLRVKKRIFYIKNDKKSHIYHCYRDHQSEEIRKTRWICHLYCKFPFNTVYNYINES